MKDVDLLFRIADIAISLAILVSIYVAFMRGDLLSSKSATALITHTVVETLKQLGLADDP